jgi:hypothetical protein
MVSLDPVCGSESLCPLVVDGFSRHHGFLTIKQEQLKPEIVTLD